MKAGDQTESQLPKGEKKNENTAKLADTGKNVTKPGVTRKNIEKRYTGVPKSGMSGENVTKFGSPNKNGAKSNINNQNASKQATNSKTTNRTGVTRKNSKLRVKPSTVNDNETKADTGKSVPDASNTKNTSTKPDAKQDAIKVDVTKPSVCDTKPNAGKDVPDKNKTNNTNPEPCVTDMKKDVTDDNKTKPSVCDTKPDAGKDVADENKTNNTNTEPCVTDIKKGVTDDDITKPSENETSETDTLLDDISNSEVSETDTILDDTNLSEMGSDVQSVDETQEKIKEKTESKQDEITEGNTDSDEEAGKETKKKKEPKPGVTIADMIDDAVESYEQEDYMKCIVICNEILTINWKTPEDQEQFSLAFLYLGKSYEKIDELKNAFKYYQFSLAVTKNLSLAQHIEKIAVILEERKRESAEEENKKGNESFKSKQFKEALAYYTEAIKRNPVQAKFYGNRSACYLKLKEYLLALSDAQNCIGFDPKSVKGYFREGAAYLALNKPSKACASYSNILQINPDNEEAKKLYSKSTEKARLDPNDPEAVKKRIEEEPELIQILNDRRVRSFLAEMERDPTAVKGYMHDIATRKKIQKLLECGLLNASGPNHLLRS